MTGRGATKGWAVGALAAALAAATLTGCVRTTAGEAHRAGGPPAAHADLEGFLLSPDRIDDVLSTEDVEVIDTASTLAENRSSVSDPDCLGALYNVEQSVYADSGWTDVIDQVLADQREDGGHWMQQSIVAFGSPAQAGDFFDHSVQNWTSCIGKHVTITEDDNEYDWTVEGIDTNGTMMTQTAHEEDGGGWACQHALGSVGNHIVEVAVCSEDPGDQARQIASEIAAKIG